MDKKEKISTPNLSLLENSAYKNGWENSIMGYYRSSGEIKEKAGVKLCIRKRNLQAFIDDFSKKSSLGTPQNPLKYRLSEAKSNETLGEKDIVSTLPKNDPIEPCQIPKPKVPCCTPTLLNVPRCSSKSKLCCHDGKSVFRCCHKPSDSKLSNHETPSEIHWCTPLSESNHFCYDASSIENYDDTLTESDLFLPKLSSITDYESLKDLRSGRDCVSIGYSSCQEIDGSDRKIISWNFSLIDGNDLIEFMFINIGDVKLDIGDALACIFDHVKNKSAVYERELVRYEYCTGWTKTDKPKIVKSRDKNEAYRNCKYYYDCTKSEFSHELISDTDKKNKNPINEYCQFYNTTKRKYEQSEKISVNLVCLDDLSDLATLAFKKNSYLLGDLIKIGNAYVTDHPKKYYTESLQNVNNKRVYPIMLSVSDMLCHTPEDKSSINELAKVLNLESIDLTNIDKRRMHEIFINNPDQFTEYASLFSTIPLLYASAIYGYNQTLPITMIQASSSIMKDTIIKSLGNDNMSSDDFNRIYRGLKKIKLGKEEKSDHHGFTEKTSYEPISWEARYIQLSCTRAYHGGYNSCSEVGYFPFSTYDYDLKNAYPTAMCLVPDVDWEDPIRREISNEELTLDHFTDDNGANPLMPFVGDIIFEFDEKVKYPCIPINVEGVLVYPRSSGKTPVCTAGPLIWLALVLGAKVTCKKGYFIRTRHNGSEECYSLKNAVKPLVKDRSLAKQEKGKGSLEELILKLMVNAGYGKISQAVVQKSNSAYEDLQLISGYSAISNSFSAMMITSIVQAELLAAQNQIHHLKFMSCSSTTDGFISNCPEDILKSLDLYGLRKFIETARSFLTDGDPELWEMKHHQDDLINFTTRGNVSLHCKERDGYEGVCAHNSAKSDYPSDSYEDRLWLMTQVLGHTDKIEYTVKEFTPLSDYLKGKPYGFKLNTKHITMDFDMKRKPIRDNFRTDKVDVEGKTYEIAHFDTEPFKDTEEFLLYRKIKENTNALRTEADWDIFWNKLKLDSTNTKSRDIDWDILKSCIMGYRSGLWDIPVLSAKKSVAEKCDWINLHNSSKKEFTKYDWINSSKSDRQANILPTEIIKDKLQELINANA